MTPTAQIAAIRQKRWLDRDGDDVNTLLALWDTHQSALRALVAQWREEVEEANAKFAAHGVSPLVSTGLQVLTSCADALERLLESEP